MSTYEEHPTLGEKAVLVVPGNYQPVHLEDTFGAIFLGVFAVISFIGWMRAEARYRALISRSEDTDGGRSRNAR
jgi:hypothetical protein